MLRRITAPTRSALEVPIRSAINELAGHHPQGAAGVIDDLGAGGWEQGLLAQWATPESQLRAYRRHRSDLLVFLNSPQHARGRTPTDRFPGWDVADPGAFQAPNQLRLLQHAVSELARDLLTRSQAKR